MNSPIPEEDFVTSSGPGSVMPRMDNDMILNNALDDFNSNRFDAQSVADGESTFSQMDIDLEEIEDRIIELQDTVSQLIECKDNIEMFKIVS